MKMMKAFPCCLFSLHVGVVAVAVVKWLMVPAAAAAVYLIPCVKMKRMMMTRRKKLADVVSVENSVQVATAQERVFCLTKLSTAVVMVVVVVTVVVTVAMVVVAEKPKVLKKLMDGLCLLLMCVWTAKVVAAVVAPFS